MRKSREDRLIYSIPWYFLLLNYTTSSTKPKHILTEVFPTHFLTWKKLQNILALSQKINLWHSKENLRKSINCASLQKILGQIIFR